MGGELIIMGQLENKIFAKLKDFSLNLHNQNNCRTFAVRKKLKEKIMETISLEYDTRNEIAKGLLDVLTKISGVRVIEQRRSQVLDKQKSQALLLEKAKKIDKSINKNAPKMTMDEIVEEVRAYRNGK